jgi:hypothetical protein
MLKSPRRILGRLGRRFKQKGLTRPGDGGKM